MVKSKVFQHILDNIKPENKIFVELNMDIRKQVFIIFLEHPDIKNEKDLAKALGMGAEEVGKWLCGLYNLPLDNIAKLMAVLGRDIIMTDFRAKEKYGAETEQPKLPVSKKKGYKKGAGQLGYKEGKLGGVLYKL